jgi:antitoxin component of RelBE/YafQ-DinJ toxin-antitoxin module
LEEIGVEMPDAIEGFLNQLVETKQLPSSSSSPNQSSTSESSSLSLFSPSKP